MSRSLTTALRRPLLHATTAALLICGLIASGAPSASAADSVRQVMLIGNSASGTVSFIDARTFQNLGSIRVAPDAQKIIDGMNPVERAGYELVKSTEGGIRYTDDVFASPDGRTL